jgi:protein-tyrosine phosphatase
MAEFITRHLLEGDKLSINVESRGIYAFSGSLMSDNSQRALQSLGIDNIEGFRAKVFEALDYKKFDLILTMTWAQKEGLSQVTGDEGGKIFALYEFVYNENKDIVDPFGQSYGVYESCANEIYAIILGLIDKISLPQ